MKWKESDFKEGIKKYKNEKFTKCVKWLAQYNFSVYLLHWFIITFLIDVIKVDKISIVYILIF